MRLGHRRRRAQSCLHTCRRLATVRVWWRANRSPLPPLLLLVLLGAPALCSSDLLRPARCNSTAEAQQRAPSQHSPEAGDGRSSCPGSPLSGLFNYVERLEAAAARGAELPISLEAAYFLTVLGLTQCELGVQGAIGEIGATRALGGAREDAGLLSFHLPLMLRRKDERFMLCGPFEGFDGDGFDRPEVAFDSSREEALAGLGPESFSRIAGAPSAITDIDLLRHSGASGFRILRLDRLRGVNETVQLLRASACALAEGGLLLLEGISGMSDRPALQEGFHHFMLESRAAARQGLPGPKVLVPFLWAGKRGGLFLADERHADLYRSRVRRALPATALLVNAIADNKFLYGSRLLTVSWEAAVRDFRVLMGGIGSHRDVLLTHGKL